MHHLIYLSYATVPFDELRLHTLLTQCRLFNAQEGLTGLLLYGNQQFLQVLEGEEPNVRATYARISRDPRHRNLSLFADKAIATRAFADWTMAFHTLTPSQVQELAGYVPPADLQLQRPALSQADTQLLQLLRTFVLPADSAG